MDKWNKRNGMDNLRSGNVSDMCESPIERKLQAVAAVRCRTTGRTSGRADVQLRKRDLSRPVASDSATFIRCHRLTPLFARRDI